MKFIDADAFKSRLKRAEANTFALEELNLLIDITPRADVVQVIRCRDCKFWQETPSDILVRKCNVRSGYSGDTDYCSYGERKDNEQVLR